MQQATSTIQLRIYLQRSDLEELQQLINGCTRNDARCQKVLYERFYGYCLKTVFRYIYRYDNAVDVVTDGYVKLFKNFEKFSYTPGEKLEMVLMGWIRRIMINTAIDYLRRNNFLPEIGELTDSVWAINDKSRLADNDILYKEIILEIKKLPPSYRTVFNLYVIDGFSHHQIAEMLGISVGTSKSNLFKARLQLQKLINKNDHPLRHAASE